MFEWYFDFPARVRVLIALIPIIISTVLFFVFHRVWFWGWGLGVGLMLFAFPSRGEKNTWGDW